jgi:hypothetical protein
LAIAWLVRVIRNALAAARLRVTSVWCDSISKDRALFIKWAAFFERHGTGICAAAAASAAGFSAYQAYVTNRLTRAQADYAIRLEARRSFLQGSINFDSAFTNINNSLSVDVENVEAVNRMTMSDHARLRLEFAPIVNAQNYYTMSFQNSVWAWSEETRGLLEQAGYNVDALSNCYKAGAIKALNEKELGEIKYSLNSQCRFLGKKV